MIVYSLCMVLNVFSLKSTFGILRNFIVPLHLTQLCAGSSVGVEPSQYEASLDGVSQTSACSQHV